MRWLVVYKRVYLNQPGWQVRDALHVGTNTQRKILRLFHATGDVVQPNRSRPSIITPRQERRARAAHGRSAAVARRWIYPGKG